jgi:CheY-like chemotaxis protein
MTKRPSARKETRDYVAVREGIKLMPLLCGESHATVCQPIKFTPANRKLANASAKKLLVVDDDPILCLGLNVRLRANHYDLCFAHEGEAALRVALIEKPDLILLDLSLPRGDGYFVLHSIKMIPELAAVPVIVLTARDKFTDESLCLDAGAKRFFEKPVSNCLLLKTIEELVN